MFGDDINLFVSHKNIDTFFASMNVKLENVSNCFKSNQLSLNAGCYFILSLKGSYFHRPCLTFLLKNQEGTCQEGTCNKTFRHIHS